jgi:Cof subfamily protein (haloacid dehalogenase superfamily)
VIKFIVSDLDGTLIYKGSHLNTARLPLMQKKLDSLNIPFAIATGRHYREIKKLFGEFEKDIFCICCEGAYAVKNGNTLLANTIKKDTVRYFFDSLSKENVSVEFHSINCSYILNPTPLLLSKEKSRLGNIIPVSDINEIKSDIFMISVYGNIKNFKADNKTRICYSSATITEFVSHDATKYSSVKQICQSFGFDLSETLFFGDGENDAELLKSCGSSFTTYCADKEVFSLTSNHTRDVIGTIIRLSGNIKSLK